VVFFFFEDVSGFLAEASVSAGLVVSVGLVAEAVASAGFDASVLKEGLGELSLGFAVSESCADGVADVWSVGVAGVCVLA